MFLKNEKQFVKLKVNGFCIVFFKFKIYHVFKEQIYKTVFVVLSVESRMKYIQVIVDYV